MKSFRLYLLLGGVTVALLSAIQASYAADKAASDSKPPVVDEKAPRQDRGASFTSLIAPGNVQGAAATVKVQNTPPVKTDAHPSKVSINTPPVKAKTRPSKVSIIAKKKAVQSQVAAQLPAKAPMPGPKTSPVITVSHTTQIAGAVVTASLDRPGAKPVYKPGDKLAVNIRAGTDCNILVFNYDSSGTLTQIFPNSYQQSGFVKGGETIMIGGADSPFDYQIAGKGGAEKIFVYAYPIGTDKPLELALSQVPGSPFRAAEMTPEKYRELVNSSKSFFAREVKVMPKKILQQAAVNPDLTSPNKIELTFSVEK